MNKCTRKNDNKWLTSSWKLLIFASEEIYNHTLISVENITSFFIKQNINYIIEWERWFFLAYKLRGGIA